MPLAVYLVFCSTKSWFLLRSRCLASSILFALCFCRRVDLSTFTFFPVIVIIMYRMRLKCTEKKRNGKLSYGASSSTPPAKITCTFVWYARHHQPRARRTFAYKHTPLILSEVYQFIFFLWCIGNLIFSSIWKEKCSLYSLAAFHCVHQMLSNSLLFRFSSFHSALILCSSHFSLTLSLSLVLLFLFAVFVTVYLPLPCQTTAQFGFSSHVWQLFYRSLWCVCFAVACFPPFFRILSTTWMWLPLS